MHEYTHRQWWWHTNARTPHLFCHYQSRQPLASSDSIWCSEQTEKYTVGTVVVSLTHTHTQTHTFDQRYHLLCKKDSSSAKATCCWRMLWEAVVESSAHLALHRQSVIRCVTHSAKAWCVCKCFVLRSKKTQSWITWKQSKRNRSIDSKF